MNQNNSKNTLNILSRKRLSCADVIQNNFSINRSLSIKESDDSGMKHKSLSVKNSRKRLNFREMKKSNEFSEYKFSKKNRLVKSIDNLLEICDNSIEAKSGKIIEILSTPIIDVKRILKCIPDNDCEMIRYDRHTKSFEGRIRLEALDIKKKHLQVDNFQTNKNRL